MQQRLSSKTLPLLKSGTELSLPSYNLDELKGGIVQLGAGNFFTAFLAYKINELLNNGDKDALTYGLYGVNIKPPKERGEEINNQNGLYTVLEQDGKGNKKLTVVGSVLEFIYCDEDSNNANRQRVIDLIASPDTRIVSMTVMPQTHQSYIDAKGRLKQDREDIQNDLDAKNLPLTVYGYIARGLQKRGEDIPGLTILNMDNMEKNGDVFKSTFLQFITAYDAKNGTALKRLVKEKLRFPNSMVDRIVPQPPEGLSDEASNQLGLTDKAPIATEPMPKYSWFVENNFANQMPNLELVGQVRYVDHVEPYELLKLRMINGTFFAISQLAHLKGIDFIHEAITDPSIQKFAVELMNKESEPTLQPLPDIDLVDYKRNVIERLSNEKLKDTVKRVVNDGGPTKTVQAAEAQLELGIPTELRALCIAAWIRRAQVDTNEAGGPLEFKHPSEELLKQKARASRHDPKELLNMKDVFGDLGTYPDFVTSVGKYLVLLDQPNGVNKAIETALTASANASKKTPIKAIPPEGTPGFQNKKYPEARQD